MGLIENAVNHVQNSQQVMIFLLLKKQIFLLFSSDIKVVSENIPYTFLRLVLKPFFKTVLQLLA